MTDTHERGPHGGGVIGALTDIATIKRSAYEAARVAREALAAHAASVVAMNGEDDERLVEVMARAIFEALMTGFSHPRLGLREAKWDELGPTQERYLSAARAALVAYRDAQVAL